MKLLGRVERECSIFSALLDVLMAGMNRLFKLAYSTVLKNLQSQAATEGVVARSGLRCGQHRHFASGDSWQIASVTRTLTPETSCIELSQDSWILIFCYDDEQEQNMATIIASVTVACHCINLHHGMY